MRTIGAVLTLVLLVSTAVAGEETADELISRLEGLPDDAYGEMHAIGETLAAKHPEAARTWLQEALAGMDRKVLAKALRIARYVATASERKTLHKLSRNRSPSIRPLALAALAFVAINEDEWRFQEALLKRPEEERWAALTGIIARPNKRTVWLSVMGLAQDRFATGATAEPDDSLWLVAGTGRFLVRGVRVPEKIRCETEEGRQEMRKWQEEGGITDELLVGHLIPGCGTCRVEVYGLKDPYFQEAAIRGAVERTGRSRIAEAVAGVKKRESADAGWLACGLYPSFPDHAELRVAVLTLTSAKDTPASLRRSACRALAYYAPPDRDEVLEALLAEDNLEHLLAYRHSGMVVAIYARGGGEAMDRKAAMVMAAQRFRPEEKKLRFFHERDVEAIQAALRDPVRGIRYRAGLGFHGLATEIPRALPALRKALEQAGAEGHERLADLLAAVLRRCE